MMNDAGDASRFMLYDSEAAMTRDPLVVLMQLGAVTLIATVVVVMLLRISARGMAVRGIVQGYPPSLFPCQDVVRGGALAALAATQARLLSVYQQAPAQSDLAVWLGPFLRELREIMDTAYRVAAITQPYGSPPQLERLVAEVQEVEAQIAGHAVQLLLARDGDAEQELLDGRLAALRMCATELGRLAGSYPSLAS
jgi:hypothetical protein